MESPFTDDEKRFVLAELIKTSKTDIQSLVDFVKANCISYRWFSVQVPTGRNTDQCIQATEKMLGQPVPQESVRYEARPPTATPPLLPAPTPLKHLPEPASAASISALLSPAAPGATTSHRPIQPRPASINGARPPPTSPAEPPLKKPRGRPPRRQNLRSGANSSPRQLQRLAPLPPVEPGPVLGPALDKGMAGEPRGHKRGRNSSGETGPLSGIKPCPVDAVKEIKEIKAEATGATPPASSESDGVEDKQGPPNS